MTWMLRLGIAGPAIRAARSGCEICSQKPKINNGTGGAHKVLTVPGDPTRSQPGRVL